MRLASRRWATMRSTTSRRVWLRWIGPIWAAPTVRNRVIVTPLAADQRHSAAIFAPLNAGMMSRAKRLSWSLNSAAGRPSAQWIRKSSSPGYLASIDLMPSTTSAGVPQNQAFCFTPSRIDGILAGGDIETGAPDHVLAQLLVPAMAGAGGLVGAHGVVEDLLAVQVDHGLEAVARHHIDGLAAGDRHPDIDRQVLGPGHHGDFLQ